MERTATRPLLLQSFLRLLEIFLSLALKGPGSHVLDVITARTILVTVVSRERKPAHPRKPGRRAPAVPDGGFDVVRRTLPFREKVRSLVFVFACSSVKAHKVGPWKGEVAEKELARLEETGEDELGEEVGFVVPIDRG